MGHRRVRRRHRPVVAAAADRAAGAPAAARVAALGARPPMPGPLIPRLGEEHLMQSHHPFRKIGVLLIAVCLVTGAALYVLRPREPQYTQVLVGDSGSEAASAPAIASCARRAVESA